MQPTLAPAPAPHQMRPPSHADQSDRALEEQLLGAVHGHHGLPHSHRPDHQLAGPPSNHHHNIDPAIAGGMMHANHASADSLGQHQDHSSPDGRKGKRELSTSKRAAQNRAAQRAFRQRKEGHIKTLETQVREFNNLNESYKALQHENYQLRDYIISLQSRLIEAQGEFPQPPSDIDLNSPPHQTHSHASAAAAPSAPPPSNSSVPALPETKAASGPPPTAPTASPTTTDLSRAPTAPMRPYSLNDDLQASAAKAVAENNHRKEEARSKMNMTEARPVAA